MREEPPSRRRARPPPHASPTPPISRTSSYSSLIPPPSSLILLPSPFGPGRLRGGARDGDDVVDRLLEGVVVGDDEELVEVADLPELLREALAPLGVHVDGRLVEEGDADVGELLEEREADRQGGHHLLAARQVDERPLVA